MKSNIHTSLCILSLAALSVPAFAATSFLRRGDADLTAEWEIWTFGDSNIPNPGGGPALCPDVGAAGSQGAAQTVTSSSVILTSSDLRTTIVDRYEFPGGFLGNPDTYYLHTGGATWDLSATLSAPTDFIRISYSLLGFGGMGADDFALVPSITGLTATNSGSYAEGNGVVYFHEFALPSPSNQIDLTFGDVVFPGFPGSFRSIDALQLETFTGAEPIPVPEPSSVILVLGAAGLGFRRKRG